MLSSKSTSNLAGHLKQIAKTQSDLNCLIDQHGNQLKYGDMWKTIQSTYKYLNSFGISKGNTILISMPNSIDQAVLFLTSLCFGINFAPIACTSTLREIQSTVSVLKPTHIFIESNLPIERVREYEALGTEITLIPYDKPLSWLPQDSNEEEFFSGKLFITTSGSSGLSKVVQLDGEKLWASANNFNELHKCHELSLTYWNYLPMNYLGGLFNLLLIPIASGGTVLIDEGFNGKTFIKFWHVMEKYGINAIWLVPSILRGLNRLAFSGKTKSLNQVERCFIGTAPVTKSEKSVFFEHFGIEPIESYGLTETTFIASEITGDSAKNKSISTVGRIMPGVEILLKVNADKPNEPQLSEIWVRSEYLMDGYFEVSKDNLTLPTDSHGFFNTGDLGYFENDNLILTGRKKDIIKKGGQIINLLEIEHLTNLIPEVKLSSAVPIDHEFYGESYSLIVELNKCSETTEIEISQFLHKELSKAKWPEKIFIVGCIPTTRSGKIDRLAALRLLRSFYTNG